VRLAVADRERLISTTLADHGQIDILVNNAAVTYLAPIESITNKQLRLMMELQVFAPYHLTQLALPQMYERGSGCVLNISSHAAEHPQGPPFEEIQQRGFSVYGMAKAAIERFTTALAAEGYHRGVRANSLAPTDNVATPGAGGHNLIDGFPLEDESVMAEAALVLVVSDFTGRLVHSQQILREIDQSDRPSPSVRPHPNKS
jgi:citronellol/citronellal dehydrogenase